MKAQNKKNNFNWDKLLERIKRKRVIPIIGHGLYLVEKAGKGEVLLYDFLADKLAKEIKIKTPAGISHKFSKVAFEYLKKHDSDYVELSDFLIDIVKNEKLIAFNPLLKLARIKAFHLFINTTYDDFLFKTIKSTRNYTTKVLNYTRAEKKWAKLEDEDIESLKNCVCTFVYNIYGDLAECVNPAFTEKDILETIVDFLTDMQTEPITNLSYLLKNNSLLFMGCGCDDWLFRFFVRAIANEEYEDDKRPHKYKFIGDDLRNDRKDPFHELPRFLEQYQSEVYYAGGGRDFVDLLFKKMEKDYPDEIIPVTDFPETAFISFIGTNRPAAVKLASNLREDGINVWLDEREFEPGEEVDDKIIKAIDKCPVFIPLVSRESKNILAENGKLKYHCREWERAYSNKISAEKPVTIMPVIIDDIDWMYDKFAGLFFVNVPGGDRRGDYEKLKNRLLELQMKD